jgi:hypothetical protein
MQKQYNTSKTHHQLLDVVPELNDEETIKAIHHALNSVYEKYDRNKVTFTWLEQEKLTTKTLFFKCVFILTGFLNNGKTYVWRSWRSFNNFSQ